MGRSLPREESMPVVSVLQMRFDYLSFTQLSAWHRADLSGADLSDACLMGADLREAFLRGAFLQGGHFSKGVFRWCDLQAIVLCAVNLRAAIFV